MDGYSVIKNFTISKIITNEETKFIEKAMKLKGLSKDKNAKISLKNIDSILKSIDQNFGIFSLVKRKDNTIYPGKLKKLTDDKIILYWIDLNADWNKKRKFKKNKIRIIDFKNDYLTSLKLIADNK